LWCAHRAYPMPREHAPLRCHTACTAYLYLGRAHLQHSHAVAFLPERTASTDHRQTSATVTCALTASVRKRRGSFRDISLLYAAPWRRHSAGGCVPSIQRAAWHGAGFCAFPCCLKPSAANNAARQNACTYLSAACPKTRTLPLQPRCLRARNNRWLQNYLSYWAPLPHTHPPPPYAGPNTRVHSHHTCCRPTLPTFAGTNQTGDARTHYFAFSRYTRTVWTFSITPRA